MEPSALWGPADCRLFGIGSKKGRFFCPPLDIDVGGGTKPIMKSTWWAVGLTYVGAVVGAGFASGQEIYQFFTRFGWGGDIGIGLVGLLFAVFGFLALERGRRGHATRFGDLLAQTYPPWLVHLAEGMTTAFLFLGLGVVASGGGAATHAALGVPTIAGAAITILAIVLVVGLGTGWVVGANVVLVPYLMALVLGVCGWESFHHERLTTSVPSLHGWVLSALLYVSYNIFTGIMVLPGIGRSLPSMRASVWASVSGAGVLTGLAYLEHRALATMTRVGMLPLVELAHDLHGLLGLLFAVSLWVALFTTGVAEAYALSNQYGRGILWAVLATVSVGLVGFDRLVQALYPLMGVLAVILWLPLVYQRANHTSSGG